MTWAAAVDEGLCFGWIDGQARKGDAGSSPVRFTPRRPESHWSQRNVARGHGPRATGPHDPRRPGRGRGREG